MTSFKAKSSLLIAMLLTGCDVLPAPLKALLPSPAGSQGKPASQVSGSPPQTQSSKAHGEILHEIYAVVFEREPRDRETFGSLVDSLNQGASYEGIYNGLIHSDLYRKLELANPASTPEALQFFGDELARLEAELPVRTRFDEDSAKPLPVPEFSGGGTQTVIFGSDPKPAIAAPASSADYQRIFSRASIFTLKRVLGDEALKVVDTEQKDRKKLASWYSAFAHRMASQHVDFGVALRNSADEAFHFHWTMVSSPDLLVWEVLNRLHRVLNQAGRRSP